MVAKKRTTKRIVKRKRPIKRRKIKRGGGTIGKIRKFIKENPLLTTIGVGAAATLTAAAAIGTVAGAVYIKKTEIKRLIKSYNFMTSKPLCYETILKKMKDAFTFENEDIKKIYDDTYKIDNKKFQKNIDKIKKDNNNISEDDLKKEIFNTMKKGIFSILHMMTKYNKFNKTEKEIEKEKGTGTETKNLIMNINQIAEKEKEKLLIDIKLLFSAIPEHKSFFKNNKKTIKELYTRYAADECIIEHSSP